MILAIKRRLDVVDDPFFVEKFLSRVEDHLNDRETDFLRNLKQFVKERKYFTVEQSRALDKAEERQMLWAKSRHEKSGCGVCGRPVFACNCYGE